MSSSLAAGPCAGPPFSRITRQLPSARPAAGGFRPACGRDCPSARQILPKLRDIPAGHVWVRRLTACSQAGMVAICGRTKKAGKRPIGHRHEETRKAPAPCRRQALCRPHRRGPAFGRRAAAPAGAAAGRRGAPPQAAARQLRHARRDRRGVADLAHHLGVVLAHRGHAGADPGPDGRLLLFHAARSAGPVRRARARLGHDAGPRGPRLRLAGRDLQLPQRRADRAGAAQRGGGDRGQALLQPPRHRPARHRQRHQDQHGRGPWPAGRQRRLHHHPAGVQAPVPGRGIRPHQVEVRGRLRGRLPQVLAVAQDQGSPLQPCDGGQVFQGRHPQHLHEPQLPGRGGARLRGRGPALLRQVGVRGDRRRGRDAGGASEGAQLLLAHLEPATLAGPGGGDPGADARPGLSFRRGICPGQGQPGGPVQGGGGAGGRLFRGLGDGIGPGLPDLGNHRGRDDHHDLRPDRAAAGGTRAEADLRREGQGRLQGAGRRGRDVGRRRRARDDRRTRHGGRGHLQPRDPGQAADGFGLQALCLRGGAGPGLFAQRHDPGRADHDPHQGLETLDAQELHPQPPGADHADHGAGQVDQHLDHPPAGGRGPRQRAPRGAGLRLCP